MLRLATWGMAAMVTATAGQALSGDTGSPAVAGADFVYDLRVTDQRSPEEAEQALRQAAIDRAVADLCGPSDGSKEAEARRERLRVRARAASESIVRIPAGANVTEHAIQGWGASGRVQVSRAELAKYEQEIGGALNRPRKRFLTAISETVEYTNVSTVNPFREEERGSMLDRQFRSQLRDADCEVVSSKRLDQLRARTKDFSNLNGDDQRLLLDIATEAGAEVIIQGHAAVTGPLEKKLGNGTQIYLWHTMPQIEITWLDNGRVIDVPIPEGVKEGGSRFKGPAGAREALDRVGKVMGKEIIKAVTKNDVDGIPTRDVEIHLLNSTLAQATALKEKVAVMPGVSAPTMRKTQRSAEIRVMTAEPSETLAARIEKLDFDGAFKVEVEETGPNTIRLRLRN